MSINKEVNPEIMPMVGLMLVLFQKNKYCANQITAVLEIIARRVEKYKNLEPVVFADFEGNAPEIKALQKKLGEDALKAFFEQ